MRARLLASFGVLTVLLAMPVIAGDDGAEHSDSMQTRSSCIHFEPFEDPPYVDLHLTECTIIRSMLTILEALGKP